MKLMLSISTITSVAMVDNLLKLLIDGVVEHIQVDNLEMDCSMNSKNNLIYGPSETTKPSSSSSVCSTKDTLRLNHISVNVL